MRYGSNLRHVICTRIDDELMQDIDKALDKLNEDSFVPVLTSDLVREAIWNYCAEVLRSEVF